MEVGQKLQKSYDMIKYHQPKKPEVMFKDTLKILKLHIEDDRSNDRFFHKPLVQDWLKEQENGYEVLRSNKTQDRLFIYIHHLRFWVNQGIQLLLFGRILTDSLRMVQGEKLRIIIHPKNYLPIYHKMYDKDGKKSGYWDIHTLSILKKWYERFNDLLNEKS